ncbi:hypothetical protein [Nostoc sp. MG11]|uniref:hypothetical protein n=1 Tax=Nostoc sp. MG11 TaxID=2721166 RepID=UPI001868E727|nr:hypothetical protein [Nostoc sp. MG11]
MKSLGIACASGSFKGVFVHGVLSAFESLNNRANAYAGASSSTLITACAAIDKACEVGIEYWYQAIKFSEQSGSNMSQTVLQSIKEYAPMLRAHLFLPDTPRLIIAASKVVTPEGAEETQGNKARRLGRQLLICAARGERTWVDKHLKTHLFDTAASEETLQLNANNFDEVAYASTRMLHAWDIPAWVDKKPYIDASYVCSCPAVELAQLGCSEVIAVATEPGDLYRDLFQTALVPTSWKDVPIHIIRPDVDLKELGVDFTNATKDGLRTAYQHGENKGKEFVRTYS